MLRIYLAGRYGRRQELRGYAEWLKSFGSEVTSRWLYSDHEMDDDAPDDDESRRFAREDYEDVMSADWLVAFTESPGEVPGRGRGGRHVELGLALASHHRVFVVGHRENVFCHLPEIIHCPNFATFLNRFLELSALPETPF